MKFLLAPLVFLLLVGSVFARPATDPATRREEQNALVEQRREALQIRKEERIASIAARREEIRTRVQAIKDEKKLAALERIEEKLNQINQRRTDHFLKVLERLREILAKIQTRTDRAETNGKNVSSVDTAIAAAEAAIDAAEDAVNAQADKVYELTVDDETTARNDVGATIKKLQEDLRGVWQDVQDARKAVFDALRALTRVAGNDGGTATPSATPT